MCIRSFWTHYVFHKPIGISASGSQPTFCIWMYERIKLTCCNFVLKIFFDGFNLGICSPFQPSSFLTLSNTWKLMFLLFFFWCERYNHDDWNRGVLQIPKYSGTDEETVSIIIYVTWFTLFLRFEGCWNANPLAHQLKATFAVFLQLWGSLHIMMQSFHSSVQSWYRYRCKSYLIHTALLAIIFHKCNLCLPGLRMPYPFLRLR